MRSMGSAGGVARTRLLAQDVNAELERAAVLPHEVPVQQVGVRACQAGQHLLPTKGASQDILLMHSMTANVMGMHTISLMLQGCTTFCCR